MADKYGTDRGVKGMKNYLHILIKGAFVLFLIAYLTVLYTSDSAKNVPMEQIAQTMEQDSDITSLNKEARSDLKHYYQTDDRNIDGYFFYKAASPMAVEEICIMKAVFAIVYPSLKNIAKLPTMTNTSSRSKRTMTAGCLI